MHMPRSVALLVEGGGAPGDTPLQLVRHPAEGVHHVAIPLREGPHLAACQHLAVAILGEALLQLSRVHAALLVVGLAVAAMLRPAHDA